MRKAMRCLVLVVLLQAARGSVQAQVSPNIAPADVGSLADRYLRVLQVVGDDSLFPWTMRPFSPSQLDRQHAPDSSSRWLSAGSPSRAFHGGQWQLLPVENRTFYNSAFPFQIHQDGIWAGKGLTTSLSGGFAARAGSVFLQVEPMGFVAQNQSFALKPNGLTGNGIYQDGFYPGQMDLPQRFGPSRYAFAGWGQTTLQADLGFVSVGGSTADEIWGPAIESPIVLGDNAAGFPHLFLASAHPVNIGIGTGSARWIWGVLRESAYAPDNVQPRRFATGIVASFSPRGVPGLEIGGTRLFQSVWPGSFFRGPFFLAFQGLLKSSYAPGSNPSFEPLTDRQIASLFVHWLIPRGGIEVYGEYARFDHCWDLRDCMMEPDHAAAYSVGLQRVWRQPGDHYMAFRAEVLNSRFSPLTQSDQEIPLYIGTTLPQGQTEFGQLLGAVGGDGGGTAVVALDHYEGLSGWSGYWKRIMRAEYRNTNTSSLPVPADADVMHVLGFERVLFLRKTDLTVGVAGIWDLNRNFQHDQFDLNLTIANRVHW